MVFAGPSFKAALLSVSLLADTAAAARQVNGNIFQAEDSKLKDLVAKTELEARLERLDATVSNIISGQGLLNLKYKLCIMTCPEMWVQTSWRMMRMRAEANRIVASQLGSGTPFSSKDLALLEPKSAVHLRHTQRATAWTFLKAVDTSFPQRILVGLFSRIRKGTGLRKTGFCAFQGIWAEMKEAGVEMKTPAYWEWLFTACPSAGEVLPTPFEDMSDAFNVATGMALVVSKADPADEKDEEEEEAKFWEGAPVYSQCVLRLGHGTFKPRILTVERGLLRWRANADCGSNFFRALVDVKERTASLALLTQKPGEGPIESVSRVTSENGNPRQCIRMENAYHEFVFCSASDDGDLDRLKEAIDTHLSILGPRREALAAAARFERLLETNSDRPDGDADEVTDFQPTDEEHVSLASVIPAASSEGDTEGQKFDQLLQLVGSPADVLEPGSLAEQGAATTEGRGRSGILPWIAAASITLSAVVSLLYACDEAMCLADPAAADKEPPVVVSLFADK